MEKKINVAELLKDCPKGMELDCMMFDNVTLDKIDFDKEDYPIRIRVGECEQCLTAYGEWLHSDVCPDAKCVLFPKGKTTWEGFCKPFVEGDVLYVKGYNHGFIFIYKGLGEKGKWYSHCYVCNDDKFKVAPLWLIEDRYEPRFATEKEKQKLFNTIKKNGYRWDPETKTMKRLPLFEVGNILIDNNGYKVIITEVNTEDECYEYTSVIANGTGSIDFKDQNDWRIAPAKFDPISLKPGDKVLVKYGNVTDWKLDFFSHYVEKKPNHFCCIGGWYDQCIPYEGNEHLLGTDDKCDEHYVTWKEK